MEKIITYETLRSFAYCNDQLIHGQIKGIILEFDGLGSTAMFSESKPGQFYAEQNILFVFPYNDPWAWMNRRAVAYTDEILDVLFDRYDLPENTPIVSSGGSMGGLSAIVYCRYAKRTPSLCVTNCPVCDLPYHYTERPDLPRTLYSAFAAYEGTLDEAMRSNSPLHLVGSLPRIRYVQFHCDNDHAVNIDKHSRRFVEAMQAAGYDVTFIVCHGQDHCHLTDEYWEKYRLACLPVRPD